MKVRFAVYALLLLTAACKPKREDLLTRKWQEVSLVNKQTDMTKSQDAFIDTLGSHTTPADNIRLYGTVNIDSLKTAWRGSNEQAKIQQQQIVQHTWFDFRKDGVVYFQSRSGPDSAAWYFEEDGGLLVLDKQKLKGTGNILRMEVLSLSDTALRVRFNLNGLSNEASFVPYHK